MLSCEVEVEGKDNHGRSLFHGENERKKHGETGNGNESLVGGGNRQK